MYSRPSSSVRRAPRPSRKNTGVPPTARNARTGEFTPPGMSLCERSKSARLLSYMLVSGCASVEEARERSPGPTHVGDVEQRRDDRHHVRARGDRARRVLERDAADRRDRQAGAFRRRGEALEGSAARAGLGGRSEDAADRDVIRARLRGAARQAWIVVARDADDRVAKRRSGAAHVG